MMEQNEMKLEFDSYSCNEGFARVAVAAFMTRLNPTLEETADVKTAVSEAVTNAIIHGYEGKIEKITITCKLKGQQIEVEVQDYGRGIPDIDLAMQPLYTTKAECDRAGMGFAFMEAFMDLVEVESAPGEGTTVRMRKVIGQGRYKAEAARDYEIQGCQGPGAPWGRPAGQETGEDSPVQGGQETGKPYFGSGGQEDEVMVGAGYQKQEDEVMVGAGYQKQER